LTTPQDRPAERLFADRARHIAAFHCAAEPGPGHGCAASLAAVVETNHSCRWQREAPGFAAEDSTTVIGTAEGGRRFARLAGSGGKSAARSRRAASPQCLLARGQADSVRCLQFSDKLVLVDVIYDLALLLMDLEHRGLKDFASLVLNRHLDLTGDEDGLTAMALFLSSRAAIRAYVTAATMERAASPTIAAKARIYLDLSALLLRPRPCRLVVIGGLTGSGKSTLAAALAPSLGARLLHSDVIRKRLFEVTPETRLPTSAYTSQVSRLAYQTLYRKAADPLANRYSVIIDAVLLKPADRRFFLRVAEGLVSRLSVFGSRLPQQSWISVCVVGAMTLGFVSGSSRQFDRTTDQLQQRLSGDIALNFGPGCQLFQSKGQVLNHSLFNPSARRTISHAQISSIDRGDCGVSSTRNDGPS